MTDDSRESLLVHSEYACATGVKIAETTLTVDLFHLIRNRVGHPVAQSITNVPRGTKVNSIRAA